VIIPSPVASFPLVETPSISVGDWEVYTTKQPILSSEEIDAEQDRLGIPVPEMIFGHNKMEIKNRQNGFSISFNTPDALSLVDTSGENLIQVSYSKEWFSTRKTNGDDVKGIVKPFDWTYSTTYRGSLPDGVVMKEEDVKIPLDKLKRPDPILFFDDMVLYEDELGDNGISVLSCKVRVMPERLLLLQRLFVRVDNVLFRVRDTRVYVDFHENKVIREYKEQEATHLEVMKKISPLSGDPRAFLRDQNWIAQRLPTKRVITNIVSF
jgi:type 2A phosphatase activator TIP41